MESSVLVALTVQLVLLILQLRSRSGKARMFLTVLVVLMGFFSSISAQL